MQWCSSTPAPPNCSLAYEGLFVLSRVGLRKLWMLQRDLDKEKTRGETRNICEQMSQRVCVFSDLFVEGWHPAQFKSLWKIVWHQSILWCSFLQLELIAMTQSPQKPFGSIKQDNMVNYRGKKEHMKNQIHWNMYYLCDNPTKNTRKWESICTNEGKLIKWNKELGGLHNQIMLPFMQYMDTGDLGDVMN